jgi:hypothetical protein
MITQVFLEALPEQGPSPELTDADNIFSFLIGIGRSMPSFTMQTVARKKPRARFMHLGFWRVELFKIYSFFLVAQTGTPAPRLRVTVTQRQLELTIEASKRGGSILLTRPPMKRAQT